MVWILPLNHCMLQTKKYKWNINESNNYNRDTIKYTIIRYY